MISALIQQLIVARGKANLTQTAMGLRAGLSRMTVQRAESGSIDPQLSTVQEMARVLGLEIILVPKEVLPDVESFVRSRGQNLDQSVDSSAPLSIVHALMPGTTLKKSGK